MRIWLEGLSIRLEMWERRIQLINLGMMHIANEFQAMVSNIETEFRSPLGLFPEDFD